MRVDLVKERQRGLHGADGLLLSPTVSGAATECSPPSPWVALCGRLVQQLVLRTDVAGSDVHGPSPEVVSSRTGDTRTLPQHWGCNNQHQELSPGAVADRRGRHPNGIVAGSRNNSPTSLQTDRNSS